MFGKLAADALGLSDIGIIVKPEDYNKVDSDDYVRHEDQEKIFFIIKSKVDEYCFTNKALIHLDGASAVSKKRMLRRYNYATNTISHVLLETAGTVDLDVEIKFHMGGDEFSIDVTKKQIEELKDLYKTLCAIAEIQAENDIALAHATRSLDLSATAVGRGTQHNGPLPEAFAQINQMAFNWMLAARQKYVVKDFGALFEKYIKN
jgi:Bacterial PH domain/YvbH-like oligomerisation region